MATTYLKVTELSELLAAIVKLAGEWLDLLVDDLVCPDIAALSKCLSTNITAVGAFSSMASLVGLEVAQLGEGLSATWGLAVLE